VIQVQWESIKQNNFYMLINGSFNQNGLSLRSNVSGGFGHKWRWHLMTAAVRHLMTAAVNSLDL